MFISKIKKNGQTFVGGILVTFLLIALVFFIFSLVRRPGEPPLPPPVPDDFTGLSREALEEAEEEIAEAERNSPIANILPYGGPFHGEPFAIHNPTLDGRITIDIDTGTDDEETAKNQALDWIESQGYNPDDYEINFRPRLFSR